MSLVVIAFALWFLLQALQTFMGLVSTPEPPRTVITFAYCFIAGVWLLWANGSLGSIHHSF